MFDIVAPERREFVGGEAVLFDQGVQFRPARSRHLLLDNEKPFRGVSVFGETSTDCFAKRVGGVHLESLRYPGGGGAGAQYDMPSVGLFDSRDDPQQS